jgi:hypothetical protein
MTKDEKVQSPNLLIKALKLAFLLLVVVGGIMLTLFIRTPYREHTQIGTIQSFGREGLLFKAWEGKFQKLNSPVDSVYDFSVFEDDEAVQQLIKDAALYQKPVRVSFQEKYFRFFWQPKSTRIITEAIIDSTLTK